MITLTNLDVKIGIKDSNKNIALVNIRIYGKALNQFTTIITLKYFLLCGMRSLIYLIDLILYQTYKIILNALSKNMS